MSNERKQRMGQDSTLDITAAWQLAPGVTYLNHGSFGPTPIPVLEARERWQRELAANPMDFFVRRLNGLLEDAAGELAKFVNAPRDNLVFVPNATVAMNVVAANLPLKAGDEVLLNDHEYGAVIRIWGQACQAVGAKTVLARLPYPMTSPSEVVDAIFDKVTDRTRLLVVSHVTSPTAIILPIQAICDRARELKLPVCVDGPHAPAMVPVDLKSLDCDYYTASCHKWLSAPLGTGFLYVRSRHKQGLRPTVLSWGRSLDGKNPSWKDEFHWPGTFDPTGALAVPAAIQFLKDYGLARFREETHALARYAREQMLERLQAKPITPDDASWYGSMVAVELPLPDDATPPGPPHPLQQWLWENHRIEIPVVRWREKTLLRVSAHLYTTRGQIDLLVEAVADWLNRKAAT
ncbi:aminotransferase class V-fold PLP-dependent enzyme [Planctomicrobium piriforme]|uniref:Isopenicillin-N epimerase n=1 Tax=Planctomicrobium piriforme TaxID=1576369 RepID=A0A1I3NDW0_9PLAN|nr:aminotransferase class V-fold PLP-dependent enzyme [Planctomicrobium piriforme]SFJ07277.1 isopenicillin-N epimerase [Planctomicrobium piriforme]